MICHIMLQQSRILRYERFSTDPSSSRCAYVHRRGTAGGSGAGGQHRLHNVSTLREKQHEMERNPSFGQGSGNVQRASDESKDGTSRCPQYLPGQSLCGEQIVSREIAWNTQG